MSADTVVRPETDRRRAVRPEQPLPDPGNTRRTLLALLASALGVFPLHELFTDSGWLVDVWLAMAVVIAPAALLRHRRPPSAGQIWIGVILLVPWLTLNFVRQHAVLGIIPLHGAWHDIGALMTDLHHTTSSEAAPVHTTVAIRLALCAVLGLVAALVDLLAVVGRRGALAGVPLLVVFTVSGAVPRHPVNWFWFALAAAGFLILLALDSSDDLQRWGHFVPRSAKTARRRAARAVSGQRIAGIAIVLAVLLPLVIPSNSRNLVANLFHPSGGPGGTGFGADNNGGSGSGGIDPFAALRGQLNRNQNLPLLSVTVSSSSVQLGTQGVEPFYLRTNVLPVFTGSGWRPADGDPPTENLTDTQFASAPGTAFAPQVVRYTASISVTGLRSNPPVFGSPTSVTGLDSSTKWNTQDMLLIGSRVDGGQKFQEEVAQPAPTVAELRAATAKDPTMNRYLQLPKVSSYVRNLTAKVTRNATTPYRKTRAISDWFADPKNGFAYSLQTVQGDSGDDLTDFLRSGRVGYCQQYAAAMGVMLRLAGVPSRVVLGYGHDAPNVNGTFQVTTFDAHAWVEAYFSGVGWVPFDPTPVTGIPGGSDNDLAWAPHQKSNPDVAQRPTASSAAPGPRDTKSAGANGAGGPGPSDTGLPLLPLVLVAILAGVVLVLLIPAAVRWQRRRQRLHRARQGDTDALWAELSDSAVDLGYVWSPARTPRQVAAWLSGVGMRTFSSGYRPPPAASGAERGEVEVLGVHSRPTTAGSRPGANGRTNGNGSAPRLPNGPGARNGWTRPAAPGGNGSGHQSASTALQTLTAAVERARYAPNGAASGPGLVHELATVRAELRARRTTGDRIRAWLWPASLNWSRARGIGRWLPGPVSARRH
jgi:transglutaminase-like putative cysteine protease